MASLPITGGTKINSRKPLSSRRIIRERYTSGTIASGEIPMEEEETTSILLLIKFYSIRTVFP